MKIKTRIAAGILLALMAVMPPGARRLLADQTDRTHQIGAKVKCMCNGCEQSAAKCYHTGGAYSGPCETAKTILKEIDGQIATGKTDEQVLQAMIQEYGPLAYVEPPKSGFGLVAWVMPFLYLFGGLALVLVIITKWRKRPTVVAAAPGLSGVRVSPELLARAREQAQRETEE